MEEEEGVSSKLLLVYGSRNLQRISNDVAAAAAAAATTSTYNSILQPCNRQHTHTQKHKQKHTHKYDRLLQLLLLSALSK